MNLLFSPFKICTAWNSCCVVLLTVPCRLAGLLCEVFLGLAEVGFFGILWSREYLFSQAGRLWTGVTFPQHWHVNETRVSFPTTWGTQGRWPVVLEDATSHRAIKMATKELVVTCHGNVPSGSRSFNCSFSLPKQGELCNRNTLTQGCFIVGCGCVTGWDP